MHTPWTNQFLGHENGKQLQVTTIKITEFKEINPSTDMIFLAQQVQGGGCSYHSPPSSPASYRYTNVTKPNRESNRLWIKISEQRKKSRLILQSGMYIFSVTNNISKAEHGLSSSESTYKWVGQAKTLQNSVNKYKWKEGITFHLFFCAVGNFFFKIFFLLAFDSEDVLYEN